MCLVHAGTCAGPSKISSQPIENKSNMEIEKGATCPGTYFGNENEFQNDFAMISGKYKSPLQLLQKFVIL